MHSEGWQRRERFSRIGRSLVGATVLVVATSSLGACAATGDATNQAAGSSVTTAPAGTPAPATAPPPTFTTQSVDIGGTTISVSCAGTGPKTVVFVSGLAEDGASAWGRSTVPAAIAADARACLYDRPGLGASPDVATPRTVTAHVAELSSLIDKGAIAAPVVLVGQGYGTFIVRQFAKDHLRSVAGLVLVDPPLNELHPPVPAGATPGQQAEFASIPELNANLGAFGAGALPPPPAPSIVLGSGALPALPADPPAGVPSAPPGTAARDPHYSDGQNQLARKSPFGSFVLVDDAGAYIQYWKPQAVVDAVRKVLEDKRGTR